MSRKEGEKISYDGQTKFIPKGIHIKSSSLSHNAYNYLNTLPKRAKRRLINQVFHNYYRHIARISIDEEGLLENDNIFMPVEIESTDEVNTFLLQVGIQDIKITLGNICAANRGRDDTVHVSLCPRTASPEAVEQIAKIYEIKDPKIRRGKLSSLYVSICEERNIQPLMKYPKGKEKDYVRYITKLSATTFQKTV